MPMLRGAVFIGVFLGLTKAIQHFDLLLVDEAWLVSGITAVLVSYCVPPRPAEAYFGRPAVGLTLIGGIYLFALKLPRVLVSAENFPIASWLCLFLFAGIFWLILRWRLPRKESKV